MDGIADVGSVVGSGRHLCICSHGVGARRTLRGAGACGRLRIDTG
jgi:hypothetical protein